ncbi:MAG: lytic transglycosylase protein [Actinomycetia bacterium]|nr:lytic transglycosylase protein [Actinomycetes bacterium]
MLVLYAAAIGTVESANGTYDGATLLANGYPSKPIIGVALDGGTFGGEAVAAIPDTGDGQPDGDARWVHAVGPFQFPLHLGQMGCRRQRRRRRQPGSDRRCGPGRGTVFARVRAGGKRCGLGGGGVLLQALERLR